MATTSYLGLTLPDAGSLIEAADMSNILRRIDFECDQLNSKIIGRLVGGYTLSGTNYASGPTYPRGWYLRNATWNAKYLMGALAEVNGWRIRAPAFSKYALFTMDVQGDAQFSTASYIPIKIELKQVSNSSSTILDSDTKNISRVANQNIAYVNYVFTSFVKCAERTTDFGVDISSYHSSSINNQDFSTIKINRATILFFD